MIQPNQNNFGFALIELVIVIVFASIVAAFIIPKFVNITGDTQTATTNGVAGVLAAAAAENFATRIDKPNAGAAVTNCTDVGGLLQGGSVPKGYTIKPLTIGKNATATCILAGPGNTTATFPAAGIS